MTDETPSDARSDDAPDENAPTENAPTENAPTEDVSPEDAPTGIASEDVVAEQPAAPSEDAAEVEAGDLDRDVVADELMSDFDDELVADAGHTDTDADDTDVDRTDADVDGTDADHADATDADHTDAAAAEAADPGVGAAAGRTDGPTASVWQRALRTFLHPRLTGAGAVIAVLVGLLGFALIAQVTSNNSSSTLNNDRPDDLVRILSDLDSRKDRLDSEITGLQTQQQQLSSGALSKQAALDAATQRADELGILAGTLPAEGPGLVVRMEPATKPITALVVLETIEELRGAGAEAIEISGTNSASVRVIASTWFEDGTGGVTVDGVLLPGTLTITAIGDGQTMQTALSIPGGVADTVHDNGGTVLMQQEDRVQVTALAPTGSLKYAHPAS